MHRLIITGLGFLLCLTFGQTDRTIPMETGVSCTPRDVFSIIGGPDVTIALHASDVLKLRLADTTAAVAYGGTYT